MFFYFGYVRIRFSFDLFSGEFNLIMARKGRYFCEWLRGCFHIGKRFVVFDLFNCNRLLLHQLGGLLLLLFLLLNSSKVLFKFDDPRGSRFWCCWLYCRWGGDRRCRCFDWIKNYLVSFASVRYTTIFFQVSSHKLYSLSRFARRVVRVLFSSYLFEHAAIGGVLITNIR